MILLKDTHTGGVGNDRSSEMVNEIGPSMSRDDEVLTGDSLSEVDFIGNASLNDRHAGDADTSQFASETPSAVEFLVEPEQLGRL